MKIWKCPSCGGGVKGPDRPAKNDVRRFCLPCSKTTGLLVSRTCPSRDKKRTKRAETRVRRAERKKTLSKEKLDRDLAEMRRRRSLRNQDPGQVVALDSGEILSEFRTLLRLDAWEGAFSRPGERPLLELRRGEKRSSMGISHGGRITATIPSLVEAPDAWALLLHEIAHEACPRDVTHGPPWRVLFLEAANEAYGAEVPDASTLTHPDLHLAVIAAIREAMSS